MGEIYTSGGSSVWNNICKAWVKLKHFLVPALPHNDEEWRLLPLWSPHHNHINQAKVCCSSQAQHRIRLGGIRLMGVILSPTGQFLTWAELHPGNVNRGGERAYENLTANLHQNPILDNSESTDDHQIFFESSIDSEPGCIWQFAVPGTHITSRWEDIRGRYPPVKMMFAAGETIKVIRGTLPSQTSMAHRVLIRLPTERDHAACHFGLWNSERNLLTQYMWSDGTPLLNSSTGQIHRIQAQRRHTTHSALDRWSVMLACPIPLEIWSSIWVNF